MINDLVRLAAQQQLPGSFPTNQQQVPAQAQPTYQGPSMNMEPSAEGYDPLELRNQIIQYYIDLARSLYGQQYQPVQQPMPVQQAPVNPEINSVGSHLFGGMNIRDFYNQLAGS